MFLKTVLFIVFSATCSFLSPVFGYAMQSRGPGNYFSAFRQRDVKYPSEWRYNNYVNEQRPLMTNQQLQPFNNYVDGRASMEKFRTPDGVLNTIPRISNVQKPHNGLAEQDENSVDVLLDRAAPCHYEEYVDDEYDNDSDYQRGDFRVYFPDGRPQNVNFEEKIMKYPKY